MSPVRRAASREGESSRRWWIPLAAIITYLVVVGLGLHMLGIAGYRLGWLWSLTVLALCGGALAWRWLGSEFPGRSTWVAAIVVIGLTLSSWLVDHAPLSKARLRAQLDQLDLPFLKVLSDTDKGHSWCHPRCPEIERTYKAPATTTFKAIFDTAALMRVHGRLRDIEPVARRHPQHFLRVRSERAITEIRADQVKDYVQLKIRIIARRSRVKHPGPIQSDSWTNPRIE